MDGHGSLFIPGDGRHSIMEGGITMTGTGGSGYREMNGGLHGFPGVIAMAIMDGLPCHRDFTSP